MCEGRDVCVGRDVCEVYTDRQFASINSNRWVYTDILLYMTEVLYKMMFSITHPSPHTRPTHITHHLLVQ